MTINYEDIEIIETSLDKGLITPKEASNLIKSIKSLTIDNAYDWAKKYYYINDKPYNLDSRKYLIEILEGNSKDITVKKSAQCFTKNNLIKTEYGYKKISDIKIGDEVYSGHGELTKVIKLYKNKSNELLRINTRPNLIDKIECTKDHKFPVIKFTRTRKCNKYNHKMDYKYLFKKSNIIKEKACNLNVGDFLLMPKININNKYDYCFHPIARLIGLYISEGYIRKDDARFGFCFHIKEQNYADFVFKYLRDNFKCNCLKQNYRYDDNCLTVTGKSIELNKILLQSGQGSYYKHIPKEAFKKSFSYKAQLLRGLFEGDGHQQKDIYAYTSISKKLIQDMHWLLLSMGIFSNFMIHGHDRTGHKESYRLQITGLNALDFYMKIGKYISRFKYPLKASRSNIIEWDNYYAIRISTIEEIKETKDVYNLMVDSIDHTYTVSDVSCCNCGVSEMAIILALYFAHKLCENVFYGFPTSHQIGEFVQGRVDPRIEESKPLEDVIQKTNNVGLKKIGNNFIYFRGTSTRKQIITVDAGFVVMDEVDEFVQKHISALYKRMGASKHQRILKLSTPTFTGYGIDYEYSQTDMRKWHIQCEECGTWQVLDFFKNIEPTPTRDIEYTLEAEPHYICSHCKKPIDNTKDGKWIATNPESNRTGYHVSKLFTNQINADYAKSNDVTQDKSNAKSLWITYNMTNNIQEFFNSDLGECYDPDGMRLTTDNLIACEQDYETNVKGCYMGVDVGSVLNVIIAHKCFGHNRRVLIKTVIYFEELDILMKQYDVNICVIDGLPETREAKKFAERFRGRVYLSYYNLNDANEVSKFDGEKRTVRVNRTLAMDISANMILSRETRFPTDSQYIKGFHDQMKAPQKVAVLNEKTGNKEYKYLEGNAPDHYYHANTYLDIALTQETPESYEPTASEVAKQEADEIDYDEYDNDFGGGRF